MENVSEIKHHLKRDPYLRPLVDIHFRALPTVGGSLHLPLMQSIVGQQLHVKAADTIWRRFLEHFGQPFPTVEEIFALPAAQMRAAGLSSSKCDSIYQLCELLMNECIDDVFWLEAEQSDIIAKICSVKGIGLWTAEMFLLFACGRSDIFSKGDFALKDATIKLYDIRLKGRELNQEMDSVSTLWSPYRSYAALILWGWRDAELRQR